MKQRKVSEFRKSGLNLAEEEILLFAKAWLAHQIKEIEQDEESGSMSAVDEAILFGAKANPNACLDIVLAICSLTNDENILLTLGVGSLEDLMRINGNSLESRVKEEYSSNDSFKKALECVYLTEESGAYEMVKSLIGEFQYL